MAYLYGASVQGIQDFIFETNKLREIVGASEIIEYICTYLFRKIAPNFDENNLIVGAAGKIQYLFENEEECKSLVYIFPKEVMQIAPDITISQTVVKIDGEFSNDHIQGLENRLKVQRNKRVSSHNLGLMISERSRRTGKPGFQRDGDMVRDFAQVRKEDFAKKSRLHDKILSGDSNWVNSKFPTDIQEITQGKERSWIAVVHADGNNLGQNIIKMGPKLVGNVKGAFKALSLKLDNATTSAVKRTLSLILQKEQQTGILPLRPIVLGGDDVTVIIRGDLALDFTHHFLKFFEEETKKEFADFEQHFGIPYFNQGLSACAGIAYIKPSYPFHYGVKLAEELCTYAKKLAKKIPNQKLTPSCLSFHKVHSSFVDNYDDIIEQELTTPSGVRFNYGSYFLKEQDNYTTIEQLKSWIKRINERGAPKSSLRNWLTELSLNKERAQQQMDRIKSKTSKSYERDLDLKNAIKISTTQEVTHLFDVISLSNIEIR
jgi:hypothetical protein